MLLSTFSSPYQFSFTCNIQPQYPPNFTTKYGFKVLTQLREVSMCPEQQPASVFIELRRETGFVIRCDQANSILSALEFNQEFRSDPAELAKLHKLQVSL